MNATPARPGLVVIDIALNMVACNSDAIQILTFPENPEKIGDLRGWLTRKIRILFARSTIVRPDPVSSANSGPRSGCIFVVRFRSPPA